MTMALPVQRWSRGLLTVVAASLLSVLGPAGAAAQADPSAGVTDIEIEGFVFPSDVVLDVGSTVRWQNLDPAGHTVTAADGSFDSGTVQPKAAFEQRFSEPGVFAYSCLIHPSMTGTITVRAADGDTAIDPGRASQPGTTVLNRTAVYDTDPLGIGGRALTILAPDGWNVEGGPVWRHDYSNLATYEGRVTSPDRFEGVEFFALFPQIWQEGGIPFFPQGSNYLGNDVRRPIRDIGAFLDMLVLPTHRGAFSPQIIEREPLPDVARAYAGNSLPGTEVLAERVLTEHFVDGQRMLEEFTVVLTFTPNPGLPGAVFWAPQQLFSIRAPADDYDAARPVLQAIATSPVLDRDWYTGYEYVLGLSVQNGLEAIRAAGAASRIVAQANDEITDIITSGYQERQAVNDRIFEAVSQTIRGVDTYDDPFSDATFELPNGYAYTYASDQGNVILTNEPAFDPIEAFPDQTWEPLTIER